MRAISSGILRVAVTLATTCFGRGLLLLSPNAIKLRDKDEFTVRFTAKTVQQ